MLKFSTDDLYDVSRRYDTDDYPKQSVEGESCLVQMFLYGRRPSTATNNQRHKHDEIVSVKMIFNWLASYVILDIIFDLPDV